MKNLTLIDLKELQREATDPKFLNRIEWFVFALLITN